MAETGAIWEKGLTAVCHTCGKIGDSNFPARWVITGKEGGAVIYCPDCFELMNPAIGEASSNG